MASVKDRFRSRSSAKRAESIPIGCVRAYANGADNDWAEIIITVR